MPELLLGICPICHTPDSISHQSRVMQGRTYIWYECQACGSVLLSLGNDRWAYQKIGVAGKGHLLKKPMTAAELQALVPPASASVAKEPGLPTSSDVPEKAVFERPRKASEQFVEDREAEAGTNPRRRRNPLYVAVVLLLAVGLLVLVAGIAWTLLSANAPREPESVAVQKTEPVLPTLTVLPPIPTSTPMPTATWVPTLRPAPSPEPTELVTVEPMPPYEVFQIIDASDSDEMKIAAMLVTEFPVSYAQVRSICEHFVQDLKEQGKVLWAVIDVYDTRSMVHYAIPSIGKCRYFPDGYPTRVQGFPGDYSTYEWTYEWTYDFRSKVGDPDSAIVNRPSEQEAALCKQWEDLVATQGESPEFAYEQVANEMMIEVEQVKSVVAKCMAWSEE